MMFTQFCTVVLSTASIIQLGRNKRANDSSVTAELIGLSLRLDMDNCMLVFQ